MYNYSFPKQKTVCMIKHVVFVCVCVCACACMHACMCVSIKYLVCKLIIYVLNE